MRGGGCKTCPVKDCDARYRGSRCAALRAKAGVDSDPLTNADRVRAMSDEELAEFICAANWCEACDQVRENGTCHAMELDGPLNKYCVAGALKWLQQPAPEEGDR